MKKLLIITTILFAGFFCKAQQQDLFNNDWYLTELLINGDSFPTPSSDVHSIFGDEISIQYATNFYSTGFSTSGCNWIEVTVENFDNDSFDVLGAGSTLMDCMYPLYEAHDGRYMSFFGGGFPSESFQYEIINNSDNSKKLIITSATGDKAYYNNFTLSVFEYDDVQAKIQLAFKNDDLIIQSTKLSIKTVSIYNSTGRFVLTSEVSSSQKVNTSKLPKGIYIVKLIDDKGKIYTKKVVKE